MVYRSQVALSVHVRALRFVGPLLICLSLLLPCRAYAIEPGNLISPGGCVGKICLEASRAAVQHTLGKPAFSEENPNKYLADVWKSKKGELLIVLYVKNKVTDIHLTSASFATNDGVSTSSNFNEVKASFPMGHEDEYAIFETGHNRTDWAVPSQGITFTFSGDLAGPMVRIAVYKRNATKTVGYSQGELWYWTGIQN